MSFELHILGSGAALPTSKRQASGQYVNCNERHILIDCGEGTQQQLRKYGLKLQKIQFILISHLHGDHFFGLPGLLSTMHLLGRNKKLSIYGPPGLEALISAMLAAGGHPLQFDLTFHTIQPGASQIIYEDRLIEIYAYALKHRVPTLGYRINEKPKLLNLDKAAISAAGILIEDLPKLKAGISIERNGKKYNYKNYTLPAQPVYSYAYCSDTKPSPSYLEAINEVDLLYHEATFNQQHLERAKSTFHSTAQQAAQQAVLANCKYLLLGHFSSRYDDALQHLTEARMVHSNVGAAEDGMKLTLGKWGLIFGSADKKQAQ
ncbi:MAG: ribonuclease Z [Crocinitomicaceae bacterium]|nr:ribonuclease Z [Crocinitomicaceae bacterium]MDP4739837.1 ribonuclease Z [Crocinitomicaceae bacterium]MDP4806185.1 ribonuclease Z [Crocinitomicaceae bacterium]MDP4868594.1 ribonuclease Z [Crocinitomicaceae bacterium]MDP4954591.1 ribonuclease Z [Crocinitomicaceae bacterium]